MKINHYSWKMACIYAISAVMSVVVFKFVLGF